MSKNYDFDYIIIGGGPAGLTAALLLSNNKRKSVALVEGHRLGGSYLNYHGLPGNLALDFAHRYYNLLSAPAVKGQPLPFNFPALVAHENHLVAETSSRFQTLLDNRDIKLLPGFAHFLDSHTIAIGNSKHTAETFIIATGSIAKNSELSGLDSINHLTPDTAYQIRRLPKFACIIGGGPTGCEIASYYAELGAKVLLMERSSRLLPREDKDLSDALTAHFTENLNLKILTGAKAVDLSQDRLSKILIFNAAGQEKMVRVDCVILATGSTPAVDLGLENAGVKYKRTGILAGRLFDTTAKNIFAIGDCIGDTLNATPSNRPVPSIARAEYEARLLATHLLNKTKPTPNYSALVRTIRTAPEIALVGASDRDLLARDQKSQKSTVSLSTPTAPEAGFAKTLSDPSGKPLGTVIFAPGASALAKSYSLALSHHLPFSLIS